MREPLASGLLGISYGGEVTSVASVVRLCAVAFFLVDHSATGDAHVLQAMATALKQATSQPPVAERLAQNINRPGFEHLIANSLIQNSGNENDRRSPTLQISRSCSSTPLRPFILTSRIRQLVSSKFERKSSSTDGNVRQRNQATLPAPLLTRGLIVINN